MKPTGLIVCLLVACPLAASAEVPPELEANPNWFGAFSAPAVLPSGAASTYAYAGAPSVGIGYRQGLGGYLELEGRLELDYFALSLTPQGYAKLVAFEHDRLQVAPLVGIGAVLNSGTRYIDDENFTYFGIRVIPGANLSYRIAEIAALVGELRVPVDFSVAPSGGSRVTPLLGGGAEIFLGDDVTAGIVGQLGVDVIKEPLGVPQTRLGYSVRIGLGYRLF
jgi:hypothetical protein